MENSIPPQYWKHWLTFFTAALNNTANNTRNADAIAVKQTVNIAASIAFASVQKLIDLKAVLP